MLSDCRKTGKVIGSAVASGSGGVASVKNCTLSNSDVKLTGGIAKNGGAIVVDKDGTLNLYSGEISGNTVTSGNGGAIYIKSGGVVNMYGGKIQNNHAYSGNGGAIYVEKGGSSLLSKACVMVVPSVWYENNPLSVIESLCAGTPVLGAEIGGIPELIETGRNGLIFNPGDTDAIAGAVERAFARQWDNAAIRHRALAAFSPQRYLDELRKLF